MDDELLQGIEVVPADLESLNTKKKKNLMSETLSSAA